MLSNLSKPRAASFLTGARKNDGGMIACPGKNGGRIFQPCSMIEREDKIVLAYIPHFNAVILLS